MNMDRGSSLYVFMATIVAATSGLLFGFDIAVINGALIFLRAQLHLTEVQTEMAASSLLFGCIFGASVAGWLSDRFGRRRVLMISGLLFAVSAIGAAIPHTLAEFAAARLAGGLAVGAASVLAPLYIAEVAPARSRGRLVALNQMTIVTGILLSYLVNWLLAFNAQNGWRWMFAAAAVPAVAFFIALFFVPESPRWLVENDRGAEALGVLTRVNGSAAAAIELRQIQEAVAEETGTMRELLQPGLRRAFWIAVSLAILQQITGINTVLFYGSIIFKEHVAHQSDTFGGVCQRGGGRGELPDDHCGAGPDRQAGAAAAADDLDGGHGRVPGRAGLRVPAESAARHAGADHHAILRGRFRGRAGAGVLGAALGDLSDAHPRARHVHRDHLPMGRVHYADHDVPLAGEGSIGDRRVLDL